MNEILLATRNSDKVRELTALLGDLKIRIRTLAEFPTAPEIEEDGMTCEANALKKAREIAFATGLPAVADDTGLEVDALGGRPGVFAARYAGEGATYEDNCRKLLKELDGVPSGKRTARFITVAALAMPEGQCRISTGTLTGAIAETCAGSRGFGYDPVFFVPELGRTLAELTTEEKNRISHRAKAFRSMADILRPLTTRKC
ncbi:MAG: non-canonical purine NTP pyrophosphatase [Nitrospira sp. SG-bin1]|nr:MAG: non-canonical purine NTP pyrophosphatase [Nitrospira sp. SG-bin1]